MTLPADVHFDSLVFLALRRRIMALKEKIIG